MKLTIPVAIAIIMLALGAPANAETRTPYQNYDFHSTCANADECLVNFPAVPASSRLEISNVSCYAKITGANASSAALEVVQLLIRKNADDFIVTASTLVPAVVGTGVDYPTNTPWRTWAANHAVHVFAKTGQHFQAYLKKDRSALWDIVACHISGEMVGLP